jgi:protein-S-isoprenylcysteine O-methyltransferase Ste14
MTRSLALVTAVLCYTAFFASFLYLIGFVAGLDMLPTHVDKGMQSAPLTAALIDLALIALFGVQHTVMARPRFKAAWTRTVSPAIERSLYCLAAAICLFVLFAFWNPIAGTVWSIETPAARLGIWALFLLGWTILFIATWLISHFELFGLTQAWHHYRGTQVPDQPFRTPSLYRWVRHPMYSGFLLAFWATPHMTYGHLLLAIGFSIYIFIGIAHEERDLLGQFGEHYSDYSKRVGMVVPGVGRRA